MTSVLFPYCLFDVISEKVEMKRFCCFHVPCTDTAWLAPTAPGKWASASSVLCLSSPSASSPRCFRLSSSPSVTDSCFPLFSLNGSLYTAALFSQKMSISRAGRLLNSRITWMRKKNKKKPRELRQFHWFRGNVSLDDKILLMHIKDFFLCQSLERKDQPERDLWGWMLEEPLGICLKVPLPSLFC